MIRIFFIDDHPVSRAGIKHLLKGNEFSLTGVASGIEEFLEQARTVEFDIVLLDLYLGNSDPIANLRLVRESYPSTPLVIFTSEERESWYRKMALRGVNGYITKNCTGEELKFMLRRVAGGEYCMLGRHYPDELEINDGSKKVLTQNQVEILSMIIKGFTHDQIATVKNTTVSNIDKTLVKIRRKFKLRTTMEVIRQCIDKGFIDI